MLVRLDTSTSGVQYRDAEPWPHIVLDDVISADVAAAIVAEAATVPPSSLDRQLSRRQQKLTLNKLDELGPVTGEVLRELNSPVAVDFLKSVTGITSLVSDPTFCRAGLFVTPPGGWQRIHEDFRLHPHTNLWNRVIMLLYCSEWDSTWGGELEMWPLDMVKVGARIEPRRGRMVIFEATRSHRHGIRVIEPHASPRVVLASRHYSAEPPNETPSPRILTWSRRPNERLRDVLPTVSEVLRELRERRQRVSDR